VILRSAITAALVVLAGAAAVEAGVARSGQPVMGTILTVTVVAEDRGEAQRLADGAIAEAHRWDDALTIWRSDGELAKLNARAGAGPVAVSPRLAKALLAMLDLSRRTGGRFDPAVGAVRARGEPHAAPVPSIGRVLHLDGGEATLEAGAALDPGAVGKGLALDAITAQLKAAGVRSAFLDFGGSSQTAIGAPPGDERGWPVLVAGLATGSSHGVVRLRDASISTSRAGATDTTPVLDPSTGAAVPALRLATALAADATAADAWSTALVVFGREGMTAAEKEGVEAFYEDATGSLRSEGFVTEAEGPAK
jgi:thiamine biosynthesis lipoprotein